MKKIIERYREIQTDTSWSAYKASCHILKSVNDYVEPNGTGVFVKVEQNYFLITAAHVGEGLGNEMFIGIESDTIFRPGGTLVTNEIAFAREEDKLDLCIMHLCDESIKTIQNVYDFLDYRELGINHNFKELPMYEIVGFPASKSKYNPYKKELKSKAWRYITYPILDDKIYSSLKCSKQFNVVLNYDKKRVKNFSKNLTQTGPELYGLSGCGLWYTPPIEILSQGNLEKKLVAIMTEWPIRNRKSMIGTRIDLFTEIIRQRFQCDIPKSTVLKLNINK